MMKYCLRCFAILCALSFSAASNAADIGRVLLAAGDLVAVRGSQTIKLTFGSVVQDKDVLRTGVASNLQVRFTDESIVSMKENSELRIEDFRFSGKEDDNERAFFRLVKGGLRAVTGLIGRANNKSYQMSTTVATIGIRGTDYSATLCQGDCRNSDGSLAKDGLYGRTNGMSHGTNSIDVVSQSDQKNFGINENFYVADAKSLVERLLVAPDFLGNRLEGRKQGGTKGTSGGSGTEQATSGGAAAESRPSTTPEPLPQLQFVSTENKDAFGKSEVLEDGIGVFPREGVGGIAFYPAGAFSQRFSITDDGRFTRTAADGLASFTTEFNQGSVGSAAVLDVGSSIAAGNLHWGRWLGTGATVDGLPFGGDGTNSNLHYIIGDQTTLPKSGNFTYFPVGGTRPTNHLGTSGSFLGGSVTVNFSALQLSINNLKIGFNNATYTMNSGMQSFSANGGFSGSLNGICVGATCGSAVFGDYAGSFTGKSAPGMAVVYHAADSGPNGDIAGVQGFKR